MSNAKSPRARHPTSQLAKSATARRNCDHVDREIGTRCSAIHRVNRTFAGSSAMMACVPVKRIVGLPFTTTARRGSSPGS